MEFPHLTEPGFQDQVLGVRGFVDQRDRSRAPSLRVAQIAQHCLQHYPGEGIVHVNERVCVVVPEVGGIGLEDSRLSNSKVVKVSATWTALAKSQHHPLGGTEILPT